MLKSEREVHRLWDLALKCRQESDLTTAIACYQKIRELRPQRIDVCHELGNLFCEQHQLPEAIRAYQQAIEIEPMQPDWVYQTLGKIQQQDLAAIDAYEKAIELNPQSPVWVYSNLGDLLVKESKYEQAIAIYQQLIKLNPAVAADTQIKIGNVYRHQHKFFAAKAADRQASLARARYNIGEVIDFIHQYLASESELTKVDILDNGCDPTGRQLAILAEQTTGRVVGTNIYRGFPQQTVKYRRFNNEFLAMDGQKLSFADCSFDLVISLNVLEHVPNPSQYLTECYRVMRPGGYGFFSWYPLWSGATGHHIHPDMVAKKSYDLGLQSPRYSLDGTSIPFWGHLLFSDQKMLDFLINEQQYHPKLAEWMRHYIYNGKDLNRWLWRDVWRSFQALEWNFIEANHRGEQPIDASTLRKLVQKYGVVDNFQICGATIIVQK